MNRNSRTDRIWVFLEWLAAFLIFGSLIYNAVFLWNHSYLPPPFFYEPSDTYMDWFNPAWWGRNGGTYDVWTSIYPPLSFVVLQVLGLDSCYYMANTGSGASFSRDCDWLGVASIWLAFALTAWLSFRTLRRIDTRTCVPRTVCLCLGWPMLNCLERGNLTLLAFPCFLLAIAAGLRSARMKCLLAGLAINFKVYLIAAFVPLLLKRQWVRTEWIALSVALVYCLSFMALGRGSPMDIARNLANWSDPITLANPLDVWNSTTFKAFMGLIKGEIFPATMIAGSQPIDLLEKALPLLTVFTQIALALAALCIWIRPEVFTTYRTVFIGVMFAMITSEAGAYAMLFFMLPVLAEPRRGYGRGIALALCYYLSVSLDIPLDRSTLVIRETYFRDTTVSYQFQISLSPFIRPLIVQAIALSIAATTAVECWRAIQGTGGELQWRFRRDLPLLPWVQRPVPPVAAAPGPVR